jgi:uncharacterized protein
MGTHVKCPTCQTWVAWAAESHWKPFCSERCQLLDLGDWLTEANRIPADETPTLDGSEAAHSISER